MIIFQCDEIRSCGGALSKNNRPRIYIFLKNRHNILKIFRLHNRLVTMLHIYCNDSMIHRIISTIDRKNYPQVSEKLKIALSVGTTVKMNGDCVHVALTGIDNNDKIYTLAIPRAVAREMMSEAQSSKSEMLNFHYIGNMNEPFIVTHVAPNVQWHVEGPSSVSIQKKIFAYLIHISTMSIEDEENLYSHNLCA